MSVCTIVEYQRELFLTEAASYFYNSGAQPTKNLAKMAAEIFFDLVVRRGGINSFDFGLGAGV